MPFHNFCGSQDISGRTPSCNVVFEILRSDIGNITSTQCRIICYG